MSLYCAQNYFWGIILLSLPVCWGFSTKFCWTQTWMILASEHKALLCLASCLLAFKNALWSFRWLKFRILFQIFTGKLTQFTVEYVHTEVVLPGPTVDSELHLVKGLQQFPLPLSWPWHGLSHILTCLFWQGYWVAAWVVVFHIVVVQYC